MIPVDCGWKTHDWRVCHCLHTSVKSSRRSQLLHADIAHAWVSANDRKLAAPMQ